MIEEINILIENGKKKKDGKKILEDSEAYIINAKK